jgi:hypothetical protein
MNGGRNDESYFYLIFILKTRHDHGKLQFLLMLMLSLLSISYECIFCQWKKILSRKCTRLFEKERNVRKMNSYAKILSFETLNGAEQEGYIESQVYLKSLT